MVKAAHNSLPSLKYRDIELVYGHISITLLGLGIHTFVSKCLKSPF